MGYNPLSSGSASALIDGVPTSAATPATGVTQAVVLREEQRSEDMIISWDAIHRLIYANPRYHGDSLLNNIGWDEVEGMLSVAAYDSPLRVAKYACLYKEPKVISAIKDKDHADYPAAQKALDVCRFLIENIDDEETGYHTDVREVCWNALDFLHYGYSVQEKVWRVQQGGAMDGKWVLSRMAPKHPKQIGFYVDKEDTSRVLGLSYWTTQSRLPRPAPVSPEKAMRLTFNGRQGNPRGHGNWRACYKHVFALNEAYRIWGVAIERFASGFIWAKTASGSEPYQKALLAKLDGMRQGSSAVFHGDGLDLHVEHANGSGVETFRQFCEMHVMQIIRLILGQSLTMTQGDGKGSWALGDVQEGTQEYILSHIRQWIESAIQHQIFRYAVRYNLGEEYVPFTPKFSLGIWTLGEMKQMAEIYSTLVAAHIVHPYEPWMRDDMGLMPYDTVVQFDDFPGESSTPPPDLPLAA